jgi:hypothetical protein
MVVHGKKSHIECGVWGWRKCDWPESSRQHAAMLHFWGQQFFIFKDSFYSARECDNEVYILMPNDHKLLNVVHSSSPVNPIIFKILKNFLNFFFKT